VGSFASTSAHDFTGHSHASSTSASHTGHTTTVETSSRLGLLLFRSGVLDGSIDREDGASCLSSGLDYVKSDDLRLPDEEVEKVLASSSEDVDTDPSAFFSLLVMALSKLVEHVSAVHSRVISELFGDNLKSSSESVHNKLMLSLDGSKLLSQVAGEFHLDGTTSSNNSLGLNSSDDNHEGIIEGSFGFFNVLRSSSSKDDSYGFSGGASSEHVETSISELHFFEFLTGSENLFRDTVSSSLHDSSSGFGASIEITKRASSSAEDVSVSEVLSGQISNGELGENDLSTGFGNFIELIVDDFPFSINNFLEVFGVLKSDFSVISLGLKLELNVEDQNLGVLEHLGLLFETGIREGLLEADTVDELGVSGRSSGNFLNTDILLVVVTINGLDGINNHLSEEFSIAGDNLGVKRGHGASLEDLSLFNGVFGVHLDRDLSDAFTAEGLSFSVTLDNNLRVHALFDELLGLLEELTSGKDDRGGTISDFVILRLSDIDESLGGGVDNVEESDKSGTIIGDSDRASGVDKFIHTTGSYTKNDSALIKYARNILDYSIQTNGSV
jgi:hypothetical protein